MDQAGGQWLHQAFQEKERGAPFAIVTVVEVRGSSPRGLGAKMLVTREGRLSGTIGGGRLEELAMQAAQDMLKVNHGYQAARKFQYPLSEKAGQCCGGFVEILVELINCEPQIFIFGAGHIGTALANTLSGTVFKVHTIDERSEWCASNKMPVGVFCHQQEPLAFAKSWDWDLARSWVVVMTHSHDLDRMLMESLVELELPYLGLIGSKTKWRRLRERMKTNGLSDERLARVHCPVGLELGGETPQEIAISISAQMLKTFYEVNKTASQSEKAPDSLRWSSAQDDPCEKLTAEPS